MKTNKREDVAAVATLILSAKVAVTKLHPSRETSLIQTKLDEAKHWLGDVPIDPEAPANG